MTTKGKYIYVPLKKTKAGEPGNWPKKKQMEVFMTWMATGNLAQAAAMTGVPAETVRYWRYKTEWWKKAMEDFYADDKQELDSKYQKIVRKALDVVDDRLTNGNFQLDQKTGRIVRVPVSLNDSHKVMKDLVDQQQVLRAEKQAEQIEHKETINDRLVKLAEQFAKMAMGKKNEVVEEKVVGNTYDMEMEVLGTDSEALGAVVIPSEDTQLT